MVVSLSSREAEGLLTPNLMKLGTTLIRYSVRPPWKSTTAFLHTYIHTQQQQAHSILKEGHWRQRLSTCASGQVLQLAILGGAAAVICARQHALLLLMVALVLQTPGTGVARQALGRPES